MKLKNSINGQIVWKAVREVNEDMFCTIIDREYKLFCTKFCLVLYSILELSEEDFANSFWVAWPDNLEDDVKKLQRIILDENETRNEKHLRLITQVTKCAFIIFNALMIGSSIFAQSGQNLWNTNETKKKKVRQKLSAKADFGTYRKLWRLKSYAHKFQR